MLFPYDRARLTHLCNELDYARREVDARSTMSRAWEGRLRRELEAEAIGASTSMEGVKVTVDEVRRILAGEPVPEVTDADRRLVEGYRDAMSYVLRRADAPGFRWDTELIVGLHDRVLAGDYHAGAGRFREKQVWVTNTASGQTVFVPPEADRVPSLVRELCRRLESSRDHPAIQAAWVHVALAAIQPIADGNGRAARVVASLAMHHGGFRRIEFTSLEEWWGRHLREYYDAFRCLGPTFDAEVDVTAFVEAHVGAQVTQVRALRMAERVQSEIWAGLVRLCEEDRLESRLAEAFWDALFGRRLTAGYYRSITDVSPATVTQDLARAMAAGFLAPQSRRGGRWYSAGPRLAERLAGVLRLETLSNQPDQAEIVRALTTRLSGLGSRADAVRRLVDDCRDLAPDQVEASNAHWAARFDSAEREGLLLVRRRTRAAITQSPELRTAWSRAQRELFALEASSGVWRALLEEQSPRAPETFAEAALMAVVARELLTPDDYCRLVGSAARHVPWLAAGCPPARG
ncbi:MAG TPA: Fic family protein [Candidatus Dormibacteraeota bacterium]